LRDATTRSAACRSTIFVAETDDQAQERVRSAYDAYRSHFLKPLPGGRVDPAEIPRPALLDFSSALAVESILAGSPATVRAYLQRYVDIPGANYVVGSFHWGDLTHAEASRSLELFASDVMPALR
jgi:alkanesulfonate monooxygenase SsuD/methylene tetrahydromethanopterin reductase-like flavin-dependent oxidoreductase (luciferase family)